MVISDPVVIQSILKILFYIVRDRIRFASLIDLFQSNQVQHWRVSLKNSRSMHFPRIYVISLPSILDWLKWVDIRKTDCQWHELPPEIRKCLNLWRLNVSSGKDSWPRSLCYMMNSCEGQSWIVHWDLKVILLILVAEKQLDWQLPCFQLTLIAFPLGAHQHNRFFQIPHNLYSEWRQFSIIHFKHPFYYKNHPVPSKEL